MASCPDCTAWHLGRQLASRRKSATTEGSSPNADSTRALRHLSPATGTAPRRAA